MKHLTTLNVVFLMLALACLWIWISLTWKRWQRYRYGQLLKKPQWQRRRQEILNRDLGSCAQCFSRYDLEVHHRRYRKRRFLLFFWWYEKPWRYPSEELVTLCASCHEAEHRRWRRQQRRRWTAA